MYCTLQLLQNDLEVTKVDLNEVLPAATIMVVSVTASTTQGSVFHFCASNYKVSDVRVRTYTYMYDRQRIEKDELDRVLEACEMVSFLLTFKGAIHSYFT